MRVECCESEEELDFLFPETTRIHGHDLAVLESRQTHEFYISQQAAASGYKALAP